MSDLVVGQPSQKDDQGRVTESGGADIKADEKYINPNPNPTVRVTMKNKGPTSAHKIQFFQNNRGGGNSKEFNQPRFGGVSHLRIYYK